MRRERKGGTRIWQSFSQVSSLGSMVSEYAAHLRQIVTPW